MKENCIIISETKYMLLGKAADGTNINDSKIILLGYLFKKL